MMGKQNKINRQPLLIQFFFAIAIICFINFKVQITDFLQLIKTPLDGNSNPQENNFIYLFFNFVLAMSKLVAFASLLLLWTFFRALIFKMPKLYFKRLHVHYDSQLGGERTILCVMII